MFWRKKHPPSFHSRYGGLWIDRSDWRDQLDRRVRAKSIATHTAQRIESFVENGYVILERAVDPAAIDRFETRISAAFANGDSSVLCQPLGRHAPQPITAETPRRGARVVDAFAPLPEALELLSSPALTAFLKAIFDADPHLFQSLSFDLGSEQGLHQDTAYVVVERPLELAAAWIALEDVTPGSGELMYMPGSHRFPDFPFGGDKKHWNPQSDGEGPHEAWARWLYEEGERRGLQVRRFLPKKGDVLIWHADLAHGGSPVTTPGVTRKSLVGHYCPRGVRPNYFLYNPERRTLLQRGGLYYSSEHYDLRGVA